MLSDIINERNLKTIKIIKTNHVKSNEAHPIIIEPPPAGISLAKYSFLPFAAVKYKGATKHIWPAKNAPTAILKGNLVEEINDVAIKPTPEYKIIIPFDMLYIWAFWKSFDDS